MYSFGHLISLSIRLVVSQGDMYLVGDTDAGVVPGRADVTDGAHDKAVRAVTYLLPTNTNTHLYRHTIFLSTRPNLGYQN